MIFIGINHPKQVYIFRNTFLYLKSRGIKVKALVVDKDNSIKLLDEFKMDYIKLGSNKKVIFLKLLFIIPFTIKTIFYSIKYKTVLFLGQAIPHLGFTSFLLRKSYIIFEDTENAILPHLLTIPFASCIITPTFFLKDFGKKQIKVNGSFELAYLGKNIFSPNKEVLKNLGIGGIYTKYSILRFVSWTANHDIGHKGITESNKIKIVNEFSKYGKVFISAEGKLPDELEKFRIGINPAEMHSVLYYSSLVYGESATMAAEAAYLGVPSIYLDNVGRGYTIELSKYDLVYNFTESELDQKKSINKGIEILRNESRKDWKLNSEKLQKEKIDMIKFMNWLIEYFPQSLKEIKNNPEFQNKFYD